MKISHRQENGSNSVLRLCTVNCTLLGAMSLHYPFCNNVRVSHHQNFINLWQLIIFRHTQKHIQTDVMMAETCFIVCETREVKKYQKLNYNNAHTSPRKSSTNNNGHGCKTIPCTAMPNLSIHEARSTSCGGDIPATRPTNARLKT